MNEETACNKLFCHLSGRTTEAMKKFNHINIAFGQDLKCVLSHCNLEGFFIR